MASLVLEGTWEEIAARAGELTGKRLKVIVEQEEPEAAEQPNIGPPNLGPPNEKMLAALQEIAERQKGRPYTEGNSVEIIRYGRSGPMYGMEYVEDTEC